ncbi:MAG: tyrosine-protein phosphatase [Clostridia bacterium]|nr:tyrosine-protein phosphatase [Clostridia bacterium]
MTSYDFLSALPNARDLSCLTPENGKQIREGRLIRCGQLCGVPAEILHEMAGKITRIVDLRTDEEAKEGPDDVPAGCELIRLPLFEDLKEGLTHEADAETEFIKKLKSDPEIARRHMFDNYESFVTGPYTLHAIRSFLELAAEKNEGALLYHCTAGKDRTGMISILLGKILGVSEEDLLKDYLKTNDFLTPYLPMFEKQLQSWLETEEPIGEKILQTLYLADPDYPAFANRRIREVYGTFDEYLTKGVGVKPETVEKIRENYLA